MEEVKEYHVNRVELRGKLIEAKKGITEKGLHYCNLLVEVKGRKFTEVIPAIVYGDFLVPEVGGTVVIFGRLRSKMNQDRLFLSLLVENIDTIKE